MEETDLFMECEEEELEPWQQMNRDEPHDSPDTAESKSSSVIFISSLMYGTLTSFGSLKPIHMEKLIKYVHVFVIVNNSNCLYNILKF